MSSDPADFDALNKLAQDDREVFSHVRANYNKWLLRVGIRELRPAPFMVLSAIVGRTLGWRKYAERITYAQFLNGITDRDDCQGLMVDFPEVVPYFSGVSIRKEETITRYLKALASSGYIQRFSFHRHRDWTVHAFSPMSKRTLVLYILGHPLGRVPAGFCELLEGHVAWCLFKVEGAGERFLVKIVGIDRRSGAGGDEPRHTARCLLKGPLDRTEGELFEVPTSYLRPISPAQHEAFRDDEYRTAARDINGIELVERPAVSIKRPFIVKPPPKRVAPVRHHSSELGGAPPPISGTTRPRRSGV